MKKYIIFGLLALASLSLSVRAETEANNFYLSFHLYYDNGTLVADRDFQFVYDVIPGEYTPDAITTQFPYRGELINFAGEVAKRFSFDPKQGNADFVKGKVTVKAPYVADGERAIFYNSENQPILTIPVADSSYCNDDGICNSDRGEDSLSCPKDCTSSLTAPSTAPVAVAPSSGSSALVSGILYTVAGLVLLGGLWWVFKRRRTQGSSADIVPPAQTSPPSLPTQPSPPGGGNNV